MKYTLLFLMTAVLVPLRSSTQPAGVLDSTFNQTGIVNATINGYNTTFARVRAQPDNKSIVFGFIRQATSFYQAIAARYTEAGSLDPDFGTDGAFVSDDPYSICLDGHLLPDGNILMVGINLIDRDIKLIRLLPNGELDNNYGTNGVVAVDIGYNIKMIRRSFLLTPDGQLLVAGTCYGVSGPDSDGNFIARIHADGTLDQTYGINGVTIIGSTTPENFITIEGGNLLPDGKVVLAGDIGNTIQNERWYLTRLHANGVVDSTFGVNGVVIKDFGTVYAEGANDILVLQNGDIIAGGTAQKLQGNHFTMIRLHTDGSSDNSFGLGGKAQVSMECCYSGIFGLLQQPDGKLLACGYASDNNDSLKIAIARFKANGIVDQSFGDGGKVVIDPVSPLISHRATSIALQTDGKILVSGFSDVQDLSVTGILLRLYPGSAVGTGSPDSDGPAHAIAFPNPLYTSSFQVKYYLAEPVRLTATLYDLTGRKAAVLLDDEMREAGDNEESLELPDHIGSGQYFLHLQTEMGSAMLKVFKLD